MNEEIRKQEISENELENVDGGAGSEEAVVCPECGAKMRNAVSIAGKNIRVPRLICTSCRYSVW